MSGKRQSRRFTLSARQFWLVLLCLAVGDLIFSPATDPMARRGRAYSSRYRSEVPDGTAFGMARIVRNFRLFPVFWTPPSGRPASWRPRDVLTSDGNSLSENLFGHFGLAVLLGSAAPWLGIGIPTMLAGGTLLNIWHEYVAEGLYCDPSWIDLWLDQAGLLAAAVIGLTIRRNRGHERSARDAVV